MESFLTSTFTVALAEIGDKTQLLSLVLAARFRNKWAIIGGILAATVLNHGLSASIYLICFTIIFFVQITRVYKGKDYVETEFIVSSASTRFCHNFFPQIETTILPLLSQQKS